jgi:hypothetical protein
MPSDVPANAKNQVLTPCFRCFEKTGTQYGFRGLKALHPLLSIVFPFSPQDRVQLRCRTI